MNTLENLRWRYATKRFDPLKKVDERDIEYLKEVIRLSPSSYGLQPYKVLIISGESLRERLREVSWKQPQITESSHLFVFCNYAELNDDQVDNLIKLKAEIGGVAIEEYSGYGTFVKTKLAEKTSAEYEAWTSKQTYIALGNLMSACAELKIDACPLEGFEKGEYNKILGLEEKGLNASVAIAVGYRSSEDPTSGKVKVRRSESSIFEEL